MRILAEFLGFLLVLFRTRFGASKKGSAFCYKRVGKTNVPDLGRFHVAGNEINICLICSTMNVIVIFEHSVIYVYLLDVKAHFHGFLMRAEIQIGSDTSAAWSQVEQFSPRNHRKKRETNNLHIALEQFVLFLTNEINST
jgi:hypothetical protein